MSIDHSYFPHIFRDIVLRADDDGLRRMRSTSREVQQLVEDELYRKRIVHLVVGRAMDREALKVVTVDLTPEQRDQVWRTIYQLFAHPYGYGSTQVPLEDLGATLPSTLILTCRNPQPYRVDLGPIGQEYIRAQLDHRLLPSIKVTRLMGPLTDWYNTFPILGEIMVVMTSLIRPKRLVPPWERHIAVIPTIDCTCPRVVITVSLFTQDSSWHHDGLLGRLKLTERARNAVRQLVIVLVASPSQPTMAVPSPTYGNHGRITRPQDRDGSFGILDVLLRSLATFLWETRGTGITVTLVGLPEILATFPPVVLGLSQPTDSHVVETQIKATMRIFIGRERDREREEAGRRIMDQDLPFSCIESDQVIDQPPVLIDDNYNSLVERLRFLSAEEYKLKVGASSTVWR